MESFIEEGLHATSQQLATSKQTSVDKKARFEAGPSLLRPQTVHAFIEGLSDAMVLAGPSGSMASWTSSDRSSERYNWEGITGVVPSNVLIRNLLTHRLQTFITALEVGDLD